MAVPFPLLQLPALVLDRVVDFLDITSLRRMRLTCQFTKSLVESPRVIQRLVILINTSQRITELIESKPPWSNFHFALNGEWHIDHLELLSQWTDNFGKITKKISASKMSKPLAPMFPISGGSIVSPLVRVLLHCTSLDTLEIDEIDFTVISTLNWSIILKNWKKLKNIHIRRIKLSKESTTRFAEVVNHGMNLKSITLPRILVNSNISSSSSVAQCRATENPMLHKASTMNKYEKLILYPLMIRIKDDLLQTKATSIKTVICPDELVTLKSYIKLAKLCVQASITLHHFFPSVVPSRILHVLNEHNNISTCIGSLAGFNEDLLRQPLPKLKTLEINGSNFLFFLNGPYDEPYLSSVETFRLHMSTWPDVNRDPDSDAKLSAFLSSIQNSKRPSVRSVHISGFPSIRSWSNLCPRAHILQPCTIHAFVNLTSLFLDSVVYGAEEYLSLWKHLKKLQKIRLRNCLGCSDTAIVGSIDGKYKDSTNLILSLTDLSYLTFSNVGKISSISYKKAFSKMKLVLLHHEQKYNTTVDETAFTALIEGETWEYLESLKCSDFGFTTYREKQEFFHKYARRPSSFRHRKQPKPSVNKNRTQEATNEEFKNGRCMCF